VAHYFASDVHLRFDRPDRDVRFSNWLSRLTADDSLLIAGDLCDFWMASRNTPTALLENTSLRRLAEFRRQGGDLSIMPGNHDAWLCPFYERELGARIVSDPFELTVCGLRLHLVHGHLLGARREWKAWMESHAFYSGFRRLPGPLAGALDGVLTWNNDRKLNSDEERHLRFYRVYAAQLRGHADLVVIGHVHRAVDEKTTDPRMIVLGGWQARSSYLKVDEQGASFHIQDERQPQGIAARLVPKHSAATKGEAS
jgi:UDP-2,3-diacylglucosamine hydrolase